MVYARSWVQSDRSHTTRRPLSGWSGENCTFLGVEGSEKQGQDENTVQIQLQVVWTFRLKLLYLTSMLFLVYFNLTSELLCSLCTQGAADWFLALPHVLVTKLLLQYFFINLFLADNLLGISLFLC